MNKIGDKMSLEVLFISGIHGVGKSYYCSKIQDKLTIGHYSASGIIKEYKNFLSSNKNVSSTEMLDNQELLIKGLEQLKASNEKLLLDGHFVLLDKENNIIKIPEDTFQGINPKKIIIFVDESKNIYQRLLERDNNRYSLDILTTMQDEELAQAKKVSKDIDVPLVVIHVGEVQDVQELLLKEID